MDGWMDGWMDGRTDGRTNELFNYFYLVMQLISSLTYLLTQPGGNTQDIIEYSKMYPRTETAWNFTANFSIVYLFGSDFIDLFLT